MSTSDLGLINFGSFLVKPKYRKYRGFIKGSGALKVVVPNFSIFLAFFLKFFLTIQGLFGYSIAANERRLIIGAPFQNASGVSHICSGANSDSCTVYDPSSFGDQALNQSMFGAVSKWINDDEYITCQPRYYVYKWCFYNTKGNYTDCVDSHREGGDWYRVMYITGRCYIKNEAKAWTKVLKKCDFDSATNYAKDCEDEGMGFDLAKLDQNRLIFTNPIQHHQQGAIGVIGQTTTNPYIMSTSRSMDSYFTRNRNAVGAPTNTPERPNGVIDIPRWV